MDPNADDDLGPPPNVPPPLVRTDAEPPPERVTINGNSYPVIYLQLDNGNYTRNVVMNDETLLITSDDNGQRVTIDGVTTLVTPVNLAAALNNMPQVPGPGGRRRSRSRRKTRKSRRSRRV
jgi:hypothetical protein